MATVRQATPADSRTMYTICLQTGDSGADGTHLFPDDPDCLGRIYSQPYLELQPDHAFVAEDDEGVFGYCLAALDTRSFNHRMLTEYLPPVRAAFPRPEDGKDWTDAQHVQAGYTDFTGDVEEELVKLYPSHLHIDIVARGQGKGVGRSLITRQLDALRAAGSIGVHLGMAPKNHRAYGFYKKIGFHELRRTADDLVLGMRLEAPDPGPPPPLMTGVIEGFYGRPWAQDQRLELCTRMASWGMNAYMYAPKDDRKHRHAWRELYDAAECARLQALSAACAEGSMSVVYAISPGLDMTMSDPAEHKHLHDKLAQVAALGITKFAFLFDDIPECLSEADAAVFSSQAEAQCAVANAAALFLMKLLDFADGAPPQRFNAPDGRFFFCPTEYCGAFASPSVSESPYLACVGDQLLPEFGVFWTGPDIISRDITVEHVQGVAAVLMRPPTIWDNLHANDYDNGRRMFLGPYSGRPVELAHHVQGILSNPNCEYEANFVPLRTLSTYADAARGGTEYFPRAAFLAACEEWLPRFQAVPAGCSPPTLEHVITLGDALYLPFQHGDAAAAFFSAARGVLVPPEAWDALPAAEQTARSEAFQASVAPIMALGTAFVDLDHRELMYTMYRFVWDIKEQAELLVAFVEWLRSPQHAGASDGFKSKFHAPGAIRGGFVQHCMDFLSFDAQGVFRLAPVTLE